MEKKDETIADEKEKETDKQSTREEEFEEVKDILIKSGTD